MNALIPVISDVTLTMSQTVFNRLDGHFGVYFLDSMLVCLEFGELARPLKFRHNYIIHCLSAVWVLFGVILMVLGTLFSDKMIHVLISLIIAIY